MRALPPALALVLAGALFAPTLPVAAHTGHGCGFVPFGSDLRLEGECFSRADAVCDPNYDGEHTQIYPGGLPPGASGGKVVMSPSSGCGFSFDIHTTEQLKLSGYRVFRNNAVLDINLEVHVDGVLRAHGSFSGVAGGAFGDFSLVRVGGDWIDPGFHTIRVRYLVTSGPTWQNLYFDALDAAACSKAPVAPTITTDTMPGGYAWRAHAYTFTAASTDPEGDPITYTWDLGDGTTKSGQTITHTYATSGTRTVRAIATDDPSARCDALPRSSNTTKTIVVMDDSSARISRPNEGQSCIENVVVTTFGPSVMAGSCRVFGEFGVAGAPIALARFEVDRVPFATDAHAAYVANYHSLDFAAGYHDLRVCFQMAGDRYARDSCSDELTYLNVGI